MLIQLLQKLLSIGLTCEFKLEITSGNGEDERGLRFVFTGSRDEFFSVLITEQEVYTLSDEDVWAIYFEPCVIQLQRIAKLSDDEFAAMGE